MLLNCGVREDSWESLELQGSQTSQSWRSQFWIFIGRTDAETEAPILWPPDAKSWLIRKGPDAGKYWRWEEKGITEDEMVGCHHRLNGCEFEQAPRDGEGQGSLVCYSPWGFKESDMAEWLKNDNNLICAGQTATPYSLVEGTNTIMMMMMIKWSRHYSKQWKKNFHFMGTVHSL